MTLSLSLDPPQLAASHEARVACTLRLANPGPDPADVRLRVTGAAAPWAWVTPALLSVPPGGDASARVVFRAPRSVQPPAGPLPFAVSVVPTDISKEANVVEGTLMIALFTDVFASLVPTVSAGARAGQHRLTVENRGNAPLRAELDAAPTEDDVSHVDVSQVAASPVAASRVAVEPPVVRAQPGSTAVATVTVRPARTFLRGPERPVPFRVMVHPEGAPVVTVEGTLRQQPTAPSWLPRALVGLVVLVLAFAVVRATVLAPGEDPTAAPEEGPLGGGPTEEAAVDGLPVTVDPACPAEGHLSSSQHGQGQTLLPAGYAFLYATADGCFPVRFNPCEPVAYVLNDALAPPGAVADVREAIARLSEATGITFVEEGTTDEPLAVRRSAYQPERYGERWAPILIGWSQLGAGEGPDASGDDIIVAGRGQPLRVDDALVSGVLELNTDVVLDRDTQETLPGGFGEGITRGRVILHELGHVLGLGHVSSRAQLMYPELAEQTSSSAELGVGDSIGLRLLGRESGCVTPPPLPA